MNVRPEQLRLYAVTDRAWSPDTEDFFRRIGAAIDGGATFVQLREKHMSRENFLDEARRFVALCRSRGVVSIINDNVEIAIEVGADGVHVGQSDLACARARALLGPDKIIGVSGAQRRGGRRRAGRGGRLSRRGRGLRHEHEGRRPPRSRTRVPSHHRRGSSIPVDASAASRREHGRAARLRP